jgi:ComF family protein
MSSLKISDFPPGRRLSPLWAGGRIPTSKFQLLFRQYKTLQRIVFPPKCLVCSRFFHPPDSDAAVVAQAGGGKIDSASLSLQSQLDRLLSVCLCQSCIRGLVAVESPICDCCGLPIKSRQGPDHRCGDCIREPKRYRIARAPLIYEQILTRVVHCFKYKGKVQLANPLAELLLTAFRLFWEPDGIDIILPVPLHIKRFRMRGFNQAYLLVRNWNILAGQNPYRPARFQIERNILVRAVATTPQSALGRAERAANIKNAFDLNDPDKVKDKRILLIDDVYTTGATVNECTRLLLNGGARHVDVLTLARAV